jgi:hypothetical protein
VHAVAPPAKEVTFRPLAAVTAVVGKVLISGVPAQRGVLEVTMTAQPGTRPVSGLWPHLVSVVYGGTWYLTGDVRPGRFELSETFYAAGQRKAECAPTFVTVTPGLTTKNVNLTCSSH